MLAAEHRDGKAVLRIINKNILERDDSEDHPVGQVKAASSTRFALLIAVRRCSPKKRDKRNQKKDTQSFMHPLAAIKLTDWLVEDRITSHGNSGL